MQSITLILQQQIGAGYALPPMPIVGADINHVETRGDLNQTGLRVLAHVDLLSSLRF